MDLHLAIAFPSEAEALRKHVLAEQRLTPTQRLFANAGSLDLDWVRGEWLQMMGDGDPRGQQFEQLVRAFYASPES